VLGPLLFVLYTGDIQAIVESFGLTAHCFADDTQIYFFCRPDEAASLKLRVLECVKALTVWTTSNRLKLNPEKTEFLWAATHRRLHLIDASPFELGAASIQPVQTVRNLGVLLDNDLLLSTHISKTVSTCFYQLRQLKAVRRSLTPEGARILINSFVVSRLDYCNGLLAGQPACQLKRLQAVQNAAARLLRGTLRYDHITPVLKDLHWLRLPERITYKLCLTIYNALHDKAPAYIQELCPLVDKCERRYKLRSASSLSIVSPRSNTKFGERAFRIAGPKAWNALPVTVRTAPTVGTFKSCLKTFLFKKSYE